MLDSLKKINQYDAIIIGAGFAGATIANQLANKYNKKVLVIDKRNHIGGNAYDYFTNDKLIVHQYGPHIFHTNYLEVWNYIKDFSEWFKYEHKVLGNIDGTLVPLPFNLKSIELCFPKEKANEIISLLKEEFKDKEKVSIYELRNSKNEKLKEFAEFVYQKVFVYYTSKQWGIHPDKIDQSVLNRVPINLSYKDTYFNDTYQFMPKFGYTPIFEKMLSNKNIDVLLNINIRDYIKFIDNKIYINEEEFKGKFIYTGAIDELFSYKFGVLPYRSLDIVLETHNKNYFQIAATINYPTSEKFTRISEYKYFIEPTTYDIKNNPNTIIAYEYSKQYSLDSKTDPYYPINNQINNDLYLKYKEEAKKYNIYLSGRLAEYKYYNMDLTILNALKLVDEIIK